MALTVAGFDVTTLSAGATAVATAARVMPAMVCVDVSLPDVAGLEVCDAMRLNPATAHIPVIVTAPRSAADQQLQAERAGADDFVLKPIDPLAFGVRARAVLTRNPAACAAWRAPSVR